MKYDKNKTSGGVPSFDDSDEFWDISYMLPQKRRTAFSRDTEAVVVESDVPEKKTEDAASDTGSPYAASSGEKISHNASDIKKTFNEQKINAHVTVDSSDFADVLSAIGDVLPEKLKNGLETLAGMAASKTRTARKSGNTEHGEPADVNAAENSGTSSADDTTPPDADFLSSAIPPKAGGILFTYKPENPLILRVDVKPWPSRYSFYNKFRADALRLFDAEHGECYPAQFFSYMPQYAQLGPAHRSWYLWWRSNIRRGVWLETDYSYILLYIYEIINLPDKIPPEEGVRLLCRVWQAYREKYTKLDPFMTELVCDYCLANRLSAPFGILSEKIVASAQKISRFREFYTRCDAENPITDLLLTQSSGYDYHSSRFYTDDTAALFDRHIRGALRAVLDTENTADTVRTQTARYTRDIYNNALCVCGVKRCIDIEFLSLTRSQELKCMVTGAVKYAENNIRRLIKVSSKYKVTGLSNAAISAIDKYFEPYIAQLGAEAEREREKKLAEKLAAETPEYEKYYEALDSGLSEDRAKKLEAESWAVTGALTDAGDDEAADENIEAAVTDVWGRADDADVIEAAEGYPDSGEYQSGSSASDAARIAASRQTPEDNDPLALEKSAAALLLAGDISGFDALAAANNMLPDALADKLNDAAYDMLGDIAADAEGGWHIIEDYEEDMRAFAHIGGEDA
ncbi:MAG: TerB N-terminal domain-containing protein [Eubacteriales bacterium]